MRLNQIVEEKFKQFSPANKTQECYYCPCLPDEKAFYQVLNAVLTEAKEDEVKHGLNNVASELLGRMQTNAPKESVSWKQGKFEFFSKIPCPVNPNTMYMKLLSMWKIPIEADGGKLLTEKSLRVIVEYVWSQMEDGKLKLDAGETVGQPQWAKDNAYSDELDFFDSKYRAHCFLEDSKRLDSKRLRALTDELNEAKTRELQCLGLGTKNEDECIHELTTTTTTTTTTDGKIWRDEDSSCAIYSPMATIVLASLYWCV